MPSSANTQSVEQRSLDIGKWANLFMCGSGIVAAYASHSDALLVDGLYSGVNFSSAVIATRISCSVSRPADYAYPFGYDAYEALYVKYRSLVLLGILAFAAFGAVAKIVTYATGGEVPELVFGPIFIYVALMVAICFGLAAWYRVNWRRSGSKSELLITESRAAVIDGVISAAAGCGLLGSILLRETALDFLVPVSDSLIVLVLSGVIVWQPIGMFAASLREVAGGAADPQVVEQAKAITEEIMQDSSMEVLVVPVTKLGRSYFVVPYLKPKNPVTAQDVDAVRLRLAKAYESLLGQARTEIVITAKKPFENN